MKKTLIGILVVVGIGLLFIGYKIYQVSSSLEKMGDCGMSAGPVYGQRINIALNSIKIDEVITIPDGQLVLSNTTVDRNIIDTVAPILIRLDHKRKVIWAIRLDTKKEDIGIPLYKMEGMRLVEDDYGKRIDFFNLSYMEPGSIYLKDNYDFDFVCLSVM